MASPEKAAPVSEGEDVIQAAHREQDIQHVAERGQMATDKYVFKTPIPCVITSRGSSNVLIVDFLRMVKVRSAAIPV